MNEETL